MVSVRSHWVDDVHRTRGRARARLGRVLTLVEITQGVLVPAVPIAAVFGHLIVSVVLAVMVLLSLGGLPALPAQNATLPLVVSDDDLIGANSAFSVVTKTFDAIARGVAGALIALVGSVTLYLIDAATFALSALVFTSLSVPPRSGIEERALDLTGYVSDLRSGIDVLTSSTAGQMLIASRFANFLAGVTLAALPAFANTTGGSEVY